MRFVFLFAVCAPLLAEAYEIPIDSNNQVDPRLLEAKALIEQLPYAARTALGAQLAFDYSWRAAVIPQITQLVNGADLPAPAVDSGGCRKILSPLLTTSSEDEEAIINRDIVTDDARYSEAMRTTEGIESRDAATTIPDYTDRVSDADAVDRSYWESFRIMVYEPPPPNVTPTDLCLQQDEMMTAEDNLDGTMDKITQLLVGYLKEPSASVTFYKNGAETYLTALTTLYLQGRLVASAEAGPNCVDLNLLDLNLLSPQKYPEYWSTNITNFSKDYGLRPVVMQIACLSDAEALRLAGAFSNALHIVDGVMSATQPQQVGKVRKAITSDYLPFLVALFDRTKAAGPANPLYKILLDYRKSQGITQNYGVPDLLLFNPEAQTYVATPVCDDNVIKGVNEYYADNIGSGPGPMSALQNSMQFWLDMYNDQYKKGKGPKTLYGAAITYVSAQSDTFQAPVWLTNDVTSGTSNPGCVYLPNFMHVLLHPMPIGDASCPAWNTSRIGKICPYKPVPSTVSSLERNPLDGLSRISQVVQDWIMPTAYATESPTPKCLFDSELQENPNCQKGPDGCCLSQGCPCGYEDVTTCTAESCKTVPSTWKCKSCPIGGIASQGPLACKDICTYRYGMSYAGGGESFNVLGCQLSQPLVDAAQTNSVVLPAYDPCELSKIVKSMTAIPDKYDACLESGGCCGNGVVEEGEACDDGNGITTDLCSNFCTTGSDCKAACNFGYSGPATKALKKIVDARTSFHPVYRWLGTSLFLNSSACKLPVPLSDGNIILKEGMPCSEAIAPLLSMVQKEQKVCVQQCQVANPNLPSPASTAAAQCFAQCNPEKLSECQAAKQYYAKMVEPGCTLKYGVTKGDTIFCKMGAPCTCGWDFVLEPCTQIVAACKVDCADKYADPFNNDELGKICQDWTQGHSMADAGVTAMDYFQEILKVGQDLKKTVAQAPGLEGAMAVVKDAGAKKFDTLFGTMMDWIDYENSSTLSGEQRTLIKKAAQYALSMMSTCDGYRSKASQAQVKGNVDIVKSPVAIGPVIAQGVLEFASQPYFAEVDYYKDVETTTGTFKYWKKGVDENGNATLQLISNKYKLAPGLENLTEAELQKLIPQAVVEAAQKTGFKVISNIQKVTVQYTYTVVEKVVPTLRAFALLGRASLIGDFYDMGGDTPIKPEFEMAEQLQLCVNPEGLSQMSPENLAKLGAQQALVAAMQFQDWVRKDTSDNLRYQAALVDAKITGPLEEKLKKLGITAPEKSDTGSFMPTLCESYFSAGS
jgi:hypothetical protein